MFAARAPSAPHRQRLHHHVIRSATCCCGENYHTYQVIVGRCSGVSDAAELSSAIYFLPTNRLLWGLITRACGAPTTTWPRSLTM